MLASPWSEPPEGPNWIREVKWDGYRAIAIIEKSNSPAPFTQRPFARKEVREGCYRA